MSKWYSLEELKRARTPMPLDSVTGLPDNHVITVVERVISVDDPELIQNNVRTDTFTLNLDAEYDDLNVVVIFTKPNNINVKVAYNGTPTHIPGSAMELVGSLACSVVGIDADGEVRAVTKAAPDTFQVVKSGAYDGSVTSDDAELLGQILQAVSDAENAIAEAETATTAATNATSQATSAATSANKAASSANSAASSANSAATRATSAAVNAENAYDTLQPYMATIDSCANILHREIGPDAVVTADDSFPCKPVEMVVYGNTVQNLWVNPSDTSGGITVTANENGSVTISGTPTLSNQVNILSHALRPGSTYTISKDVETAGVYFRVQSYDSDGSFLRNEVNADGWGNVKTFTLHDDAAYVYFGVSVAVGQAASGTYRVMLNEGTTAEPWCPPGLNSVGDGGNVKVVTAGKNLFNATSDNSSGVNVGADGAITLRNDFIWASFDAQIVNIPKGTKITLSKSVALGGACGPGVWLYNDTSDSDYRVEFAAYGSTNEYTYTTTLDYNRIRCFINGRSVTANTPFYVQLELGSTATDYEPPSITTTPIDLQGHTLNSLPDGTRDELHIDGGGNVVLEKRTWSDVFDGTEGWVDSTNRYGLNNGATFATTADTVVRDKQLADTLPVIENIGGSNGIRVYSPRWVDASIASMLGDLAGFKAWLGNNNTTLIYKLAEPQTIDLGTITPPTMAAPNVTAYVADDTPAEMELDYVRDINIVVDRLEKKVADLVVTEATYV